MVLLVLSAMAATSKTLYPYINNAVNENLTNRYREVAKYLLLNSGAPSGWGQSSQTVPEAFGLAKANCENAYELDVDKVSRLNSENLYNISYGQVFTVLGMSDVSFRMVIEPIFQVAINLTSTSSVGNATIYQFEISAEKHGVPIEAELKCYIIGESYLDSTHAHVSNGITHVNVTLSNNINGPALLIALAKNTYNSKITSFGAYAFAHGSAEPKPDGTFLRLSPLDYSVDVSLEYSAVNLSNVYALTFDYNSTLTPTSSGNQSVVYVLPRLLDASPMIVVATGWNSTAFFAEWTAYPQIPVQIGADFAASTLLSNVFAYTFTVVINSALYECTIWVGGPRS
jgi:hypothetical protein